MGQGFHVHYFFFFFFNFIFIYLFIYGCVGSSFLCEGFLQLRQVGATLHRDARASHYHGFSCCRAQAPDAQAQQLRLTGPAAPRHVGSSQTRAWTHVPCIGRQTLNHCATREAPMYIISNLYNYLSQLARSMLQIIAGWPEAQILPTVQFYHHCQGHNLEHPWKSMHWI